VAALMAKGRTNQPLEIAVWSGWIDHPAISELREHGHNIAVYPASTGTPPDWICHPAAGWHDIFFTADDKGNRPYVQARLKAERARKRGK
jgi:hypothetical protein